MTARGKPVSALWRQTAISAALACVFAAGQAQANGTDPAVVAGQVSFSTAGSSLSITNSPGAIINWQGFSIGASETTRFIQQSAASSVLNRVIGPDPSVILGTLTSNGRVFLINPSGILFGQDARIDVAGLVASTLNLSNQDFLTGRLNFASDPLAGTVENQGSITTPSGGSVYLVGTNVSNSGIINSPQGDVILAAGQSVSIFDTSTPGVRVELTAGDNAAVNLGEILAQSGEVGIYGAALRNAGIINADQVVRDTSGKIVLRAKQDVTLEAGSRLSANGEQGGAITVQSESGTTLVSGMIEAKGTGAGQTGGAAHVLGDKVGLLDHANIDVSGDAGGGTVLVGGNFHGTGPEQNAFATTIGANSSVNADAINSGNGGRIAVWSDGDTSVAGKLTARGGANSGAGGFIETSGKHLSIADSTRVNTLAPYGKVGTWLLDPLDFTIGALGDILGTTLSTMLGSNSVVISTVAGTNSATNLYASTSGNGDIFVNEAVSWTATTTLTLNADRDVIVKVGAAITGENGSLVANAGRDVSVNAAITTTTGNFTFIAGNDVNINAAMTVTTGNMVLRADNDGTGPGGGTVVITCATDCLTITAGVLSIRFNPADYSTATMNSAITAYGLKLTGAGTEDFKAWVFAQGNNKPYDGLLTATVNASFKDPLSTLPAGVTLGTVTTPLFDTKDAGTNKLITFGSNFTDPVYALFAPFGTPVNTGTTRANIAAKTVTLFGSKTYNGTTSLTGAVTLATGISGEALTYSGATANDAHVATANKYVNAITLLDGTGLASNYQLPALNVANAPVTISTATLTPTLTNNPVTKTYDGTTDAPAGFSPTYSFAGLVSGDTAATLANTGSAYDDKDVADATKVTVSGLSITGITGSNSSAISDYALDAASKDVAATITAKTVTISGSKTYNGTTGLAGAVTLATGISGEALTYSGATASDAHVATANKYVNAITLADGTGLASNYQLPTLNAANAPVTISTATLTPTLTNDPVTKTYDGTTDAPAGFSPTYSFAGLVSGDTAATLANTASAYNDKDVLDANKVTVSGLSITGITGGNSSAITDYALDAASKNVTATITPKALTQSGLSVAASKIYDATTGTTLIGASALLAAEAPGTGTTADGKAYNVDDVSLTGTSVGTYNSKDVATASTVTFSGLTLGGAQAGNYSLTPHATQAATITPRALTIVADALSKVYGATDPVLTYVANGFQLGDSAGTLLSGALSRATGENVGNYAIGKNTLASNANYTVTYTGNNLGITPAPLNVAANPQSKLFGASDPAFTFSVTGLVNNPALGIADIAGSVLSGALTRVPGESALGGPYAITQGSLAANSNYSLGFTPNILIITGAAAEPVLGFNAEQVVFVGVINNEFYYRPGNFWHISLNPNNADPGFDVMRGTNDLKSRLGDRLNRCDSVSGGGFCETWSFPEQREKGNK